jgi:hypothetical protein
VGNVMQHTPRVLSMLQFCDGFVALACAHNLWRFSWPLSLRYHQAGSSQLESLLGNDLHVVPDLCGPEIG